MQARSLHETDHWPSPHTVEGAGENEESLSVITLAQTSPCRPQVMPVDVDDTTKLSVERKPQQLSIYHIYPTNLRKRLLSNDPERQAHTFQQMSQDSRRKVRRKQQRGPFFHRLVPSSSSLLVRPECSS